MSLKSFHIFFIIVSCVFCMGLGVWGVMDFQETGNGQNLALAAVGFISGVSLVIYGIWFLRKLKGVNSP